MDNNGNRHAVAPYRSIYQRGDSRATNPRRAGIWFASFVGARALRGAAQASHGDHSRRHQKAAKLALG